MKSNPGSRPALSILIVEDDKGAIEFLFRLVAKRYPDYLIHLAENGQQGMDLFKKQRPDLVITDIDMPVMDGIEMAGKIKALDAGAHIIATTAKSDTHYLLDAIKIGITRYVLKPIDIGRLFESIDDCLDRITLKRQITAQNDFIRKLSRAVEQSTNMIIIADASGAIEYVNPMFTEITGYAPEEVTRQSLRVLLPLETYEMLRSAMTRGLEWRGEFVNRKKSGELFCVEASISTLAAEDGRTTHLVAVLQDISERKQAEEYIRRMNGELEQRVMERTVELEISNNELESFCYSVSHDLRAPLRGMGGFSDILQEEYADKLDEAGKECFHRIKSAAVTMGQLIDDLLNLSQVTRGHLCREKVNLSAIANDIVQQMAEHEPQRQVEVIVSEGIEADGDPNLIRLVLGNLLGNAWKYTGNEPYPRIKFGSYLLNGEPVYFVQDNGIGFDVAHASMLFRPFHRLHGVGEFEGHGIGLAMVQGIVSRHGGQTWAEGEVGKGAKFLFTLRSCP
jgi:PAS domain S-box-containing protein